MSDSESSGTRPEEEDKKLVDDDNSSSDSDSSDEEPEDENSKSGQDEQDDDPDEQDVDSGEESSIYEDDSDAEPVEKPDSLGVMVEVDQDVAAKELKKKVWLDHGWDESLPIPKMKKVETFLKFWKKGHKNSLPKHGDFCKGLEFDVSEDKQIKIFEIILGKLNSDGKLDQQRQKNSMRFLWKQQFPKSKREKDGISFSEIENEEMIQVEEAYVPLLETAVKNMLERAKKCDKGHLPKAKIAAWEARLKKTKEVLVTRKKKQTEFNNQRARRAEKVGKARSKKANKGIDWSSEDVEQQIQKNRQAIKKAFDKLIAEGVPSADAIDQALGIMDV
jgi:hypothetical protein